MSIFTRIRSFKSGEAKAHRDFEFIQGFEAEHAKRHAEIGDYDCSSVSARFYASLGEDVDRDDTWEHGAYIATSEALMREAVAVADIIGRFKEMFPDSMIVPLQIQEGESEESVQQRLRQAFEDSVALAHLDEEFGVSGNEDDDEEKK